MTAAVPTLRALPANVTHERRELDRRFPARAMSVKEDDGRRTYWVQAGRSEVLADDYLDQRRRIALHNLINQHTTRDECMDALRDPERTL